MFRSVRREAKKLAHVAVATLALYNCAGEGAAPDTGATPAAAIDGSARPDGAAAAARLTAVNETNPAWALGVRHYAVTIAPPGGDPATSPLVLLGRALDAAGAAQYDVSIEFRIDAMTAWAQGSQGTGAPPSAADLASFFGAITVTGPGGAAVDEATLTSAAAGLLVAHVGAPGAADVVFARGPGDAAVAAAALTAGNPAACVSEDEAHGNVFSMWGSMAFCAAEIGVGVAAGPWAAVALMAASSLAGGVGCSSIYGLLCDQLSLVYRQACCVGDTAFNYDKSATAYGVMCPFGDPIPAPSSCGNQVRCVEVDFDAEWGHTRWPGTYRFEISGSGDGPEITFANCETFQPGVACHYAYKCSNGELIFAGSGKEYDDSHVVRTKEGPCDKQPLSVKCEPG